MKWLKRYFLSAKILKINNKLLYLQLLIKGHIAKFYEMCCLTIENTF